MTHFFDRSDVIDPNHTSHLPKNYVIPHTSSLYHIKHTGRVVLPEFLEQVFVQGFTGAFAPDIYRDYRDMHSKVVAAAIARGYDIKQSSYTYQMCANLWRVVAKTCDNNMPGAQLAAVRYTDVFVAAVLACSISNTDVFV